MEAQALEGGFSNAPVESSYAFRTALNVMARPGMVETLTGAMPPVGLSVAAGTLLLTLCDHDTPIHLAGNMDTQAIRDWLTFHTGTPFVDTADAMFAVGAWDALMPITRFAVGTPQYPDRSTTLIVEGFGTTKAELAGPGIETKMQGDLPDVKPFQLNAALFPLGCDFYFTNRDQISALPRTTRVEVMPCM